MQVPLISDKAWAASQLTGAQPFLVTMFPWSSAQTGALLPALPRQLLPRHAWPGDGF